MALGAGSVGLEFVDASLRQDILLLDEAEHLALRLWCTLVILKEDLDALLSVSVQILVCGEKLVLLVTDVLKPL